MKRILRSLASLRLTVVLLVMALVLVFVGTLAQVQMGMWETVATYFRSWVAWVDPSQFAPSGSAPPWLRFPMPGGLTISALMILNLVAAHLTRFRFSASRAGILLLHAGLIVLLMGEFITGYFSNEGLMRIDVGGSSSFVEDVRSAELAVLDTTRPDLDRVISIPQWRIVKAMQLGERIRHPDLPFEVEVTRWYPNARLIRPKGPTPATQGVGLEAQADEQPQSRGVDGGATDAPAAYVSLFRDGAAVGTWLVSADLLDAQEVLTGGQKYGISLRYARRYLPYEIHLLEFRHDKFVGTQIARNFSSRVRLHDMETGVDRETKIWMNNPLRYRGATFYQASYKPDGSGTVLQVVKNPAAPIPYVASAMISAGMVWHFLMVLTGYLKRQNASSVSRATGKASLPVPASIRGGFWHTGLPVLAAAVGMLVALAALFRSPPASEFDLKSFAAIPVSSGGRIKPMDTAARHLVSIASGRQSVRGPEGTVTAVRYLLDLVAQPDSMRDLPIVRVDHPDVLAMLGLAPEDAGRLGMGKIEPFWHSIQEQAQLAFALPKTQRDSTHEAVLKLYNQVSELLSYSALEEPYGIPPLGPNEEWAPFARVFQENSESDSVHPAVAYQVAMFKSWHEKDPASFNKAVRGYLDLLERDMPDVTRKARLEVLFNRAQLFIGALSVYIMSFLCICLGLLLRHWGGSSPAGEDWGERMRRCSVSLLWVAVVVHTVALFARIYLQGRPPVTNLYSSAIFTGWAAVLLGLALEHLHRLGVAALGASTVGFVTLVVAHNLGTDGDTMQMMQAVLDSNFWLATHVIAITLGYSATFMAGALAAIYLVFSAGTKRLSPDRRQGLYRMVYGTVCFALLLSFVGTVLGGIWADQSWGRFWGWDPKENGAAMVVLINAIILHARWGGMIRERGMMVLAVFGNIVTAWSWFGTNMLGVGLHSYGFANSAFTWMVIFVASQFALMSLGWLQVSQVRAMERAGSGEATL
ncbi:cytochrome c biogenesis protein CcsA [Candidatus Sumerlaeota bacterium]|nr:cytochrome c biogenesis protein CcsA [Candidatus Sumerlaeota bacterium]